VIKHQAMKMYKVEQLVWFHFQRFNVQRAKIVWLKCPTITSRYEGSYSQSRKCGSDF